MDKPTRQTQKADLNKTYKTQNGPTICHFPDLQILFMHQQSFRLLKGSHSPLQQIVKNRLNFPLDTLYCNPVHARKGQGKN
jgi:hypothetical protein